MPNQYTLKDLEHSRKQVTITEIDKALLEKTEQKVIHDLSQKLKLKGFRPGKVPEAIVRQEVEASFIQINTLEQALPLAMNEILVEKSLRILGQPDVKFDSIDPLKITLEFDVLPKIELGNYQKIAVKLDKKTASDEDVTNAIEEMRKRMIDYQEVDRAAQKGDRVEIDFEGFTPDGVPLDNTKSKNHPIVLGSNLLIPGFEDEVVGMKKGEDKEFLIGFPKDYHAKHLAGTKVKFKTHLHRIEEGKLPEVDEVFVEKVAGKKQAVEEWKKTVRTQIQSELDQIASREFEEAYFDQLIKLTKAELPQTLITDEKQAVLQEIKERILYQGLSYERYLAAAGKNEEQLLESFLKQAEDRIKLRLALQEIAEKEQIMVSDLDVEERLNELLSRQPENQRQQLKQQYKPGSAEYRTLEYHLRMQKTLEKILPKV